MIEQHSLTEDYENLWKFTGHELDKETGMYYAGARYYDPRTSIFISVDPLAELMPSFGGYIYTFNNPIRYTDPTGMMPNKDKDSCPDGPCNDIHMTQDTVVITHKKSDNKGSRSRTSFKGAVPDWLKYGEQPYTWNSPYAPGEMDRYNEEQGTNYTEGNQYYQWYYDNIYKPEFDAMIADIGNAQAAVGKVILAAAAAPFIIGGLASGGGALLLNSGYKGFFARAGLDASIQYGITGDVDLIGATASGVGFRKYGFMANAAGASSDYTLFGGQYRDVFGTKPISHGIYDFMGGLGPNLGRAVSTPGNSLGPVGIHTTGNAWGTWMSQRLKNQ